MSAPVNHASFDFTCPVCGACLNAGIRVKTNSYVIWCSKGELNCPASKVDGVGEDWESARKDLLRKVQGKAPAEHHREERAVTIQSEQKELGV